ncbi:MAG: tocopherol cyclase, partial [Okeania sp. SIO2F4]
CRDTMRGNLTLKLREVRDGYSKLILDARSDLCGLEVGGESWEQPWVK